MNPLPIDQHLPGILREMAKTPNFVLQASPGSGKTTRLPPAMLNSPLIGPNEQVWVLEPRRLAAKWAAHRIAEEAGERVGETVGYQFRWEKVVGPKTRLLFLTEGTFLKRLTDNPTLKGVKAVVLDEFHERHLQTDVALACLRSLQATVRSDLKIVICSATIDVESIVGALLPCGRLDVELPRHPVDTRYVDKKGNFETQVALAFLEVLRKGEVTGHTLIFLPGMSEMRRAGEILQAEIKSPDFTLHLLHGDLDRTEQDAAIRPSVKKKIILSTNIAESSLTIEGVALVIDTGVFRQLHESPWSGIPRLRLRPVSKASAIQRAGRAGRTGPGICLRLFSRHDYETRPAYEVPEIRRADLAETYLSLKGMGYLDGVKWLEPPDDGRVNAAIRLLFLLGALETETQPSPLTQVGRAMAELPLSPRLSRVLVEAESRGVIGSTIDLVALLSEGETPTPNLFNLIGKAPTSFGAKRVQRQLQGIFRVQSNQGAGDANAVGFSFLTGFPDRVAKRKLNSTAQRLAHGKSEEWLLSEGGVALWTPGNEAFETPWFLALEVQETERQAGTRVQPKISLMAPIDENWLFDLKPSRISEGAQVEWDSATNRLTQFSFIRYSVLPVVESKERPTPGDAAAEALLEKGIGISKQKVLASTPAEWPELLARLGIKAELENLLGKVSLALEAVPDGPFVVGSSEQLWETLKQSLHNAVTESAAKELPWADLLTDWICKGKAYLLEEWVPTSVKLLHGKNVTIHYERGNKPWIESRLQDFFGTGEGPAILKGRLPLTLHLLAPNGRAVQVTSDLKGFWARHYAEVRKELSRRYPRHHWPDNPLIAEKREWKERKPR